MQEVLRCRVTLQVTFPDADSDDASEYLVYLDAFLEAVKNAKNVKCTDVVLRDAARIGPSDEYEDWKGGPTFDFGILAPEMGQVFALDEYPVPLVQPREIADVWDVLSKAERGELRQNVSVAVGQVLGPNVDANAVLARTYVLRVLQAAGHLKDRDSEELFAKAAQIPLERAPLNASDLTQITERFM